MHRLLLALLVVLSPAVRAAEAATTEAPTKLSPYEVRANSVEFTHWIKVGSPNFIIYTDATGSDASRVLRECEMMRFASQVVFGRKAAKLGPTVLIMPTATSDWRKLETKGGVEEWKSAAVSPGGRVADIIVVQYDWQGEGLGVLRSALSFSDMRRMDLSGPFWFTRGFGMFFQTADFDGDIVSLGHVNPIVMGLKQRTWLPWGRFFEVNPTSPEFTKEDRVNQYEAQTAIFTQYIFANPDRVWLGRLASWIDDLRSGVKPTETQFKARFGDDWKEWQRRMEAYLDSGRYNLFQVSVPPSVTGYSETNYKLPVKEMRELFILTQTLVQTVPESEASLDALLAGGLQSEPLREMLVEACERWDRRDAALASVRKLIADGSTNPRVYRQGDALLTAAGGAFGLDCRYGPELKEVRAWDRRGLELEPLFIDLNESLAVNEACAAVVDQQSITTIEACYGRIKGRVPTDRVVVALAMALWRIGDTKTAGELATRLRDDPLVAKRIRSLASELLTRIGETSANRGPAGERTAG